MDGSETMRVAVSACLLGEKCKYNGGSNRRPELIEALRAAGCELVPVCPEQLGGLPTPRPRSEIRDGRVVNEFDESVDDAFRLGAKRAWDATREAGGCDVAVLQPRSPSCGVRRVYDGTFSGALVDGDGVFARLLIDKGVPVMTPEGFVEEYGGEEAIVDNGIVNPVDAFDMRIAHIGINAADEAEASSIAGLFESLLGMARVDTPVSVFADTLVEVMKQPFRGAHGHIGLAVNDLPAAEAYFKTRGLTINEASRALNPDGTTKLVYFNEEIAGFAIHLCCS